MIEAFENNTDYDEEESKFHIMNILTGQLKMLKMVIP